ncbi:MAG: hypothetical protein HZC36_16195 [Armatimonadetes bacterium]|nr:hypothetical protein [Armatimonadota bacterium]
MSSPKVPVWVLASVLVCAAVSCVSLLERFKVERHNRSVMIALELESVERIAAAQGLDLADALPRLKEAGLRAIVESEKTVGNLMDEGMVRFSPEEVSDAYHAADGGHAYEISAFDIAQVANALNAQFPGSVTVNPKIKDNGWETAGVEGVQPDVLRSVVVGLRRSMYGTGELHGLEIIARYSNTEGSNPAAIAFLLREAQARYFLPMGDQVLGRRQNIPALIEALRANNMIFANPEFAKMGGIANVLDQAPELTVRLHSAQAAELDKMPDSAAVERYVKAAAERGIRILLLRPLNFSGPAPLDSLAHFVAQVSNGLQREGLGIGPARPYEDPGVPKVVFLGIGLAAAPVLFFVFSSLVSGQKWQLLGGALSLGLGAGAYLDSARPYTALACAVAFPTLAFLILDTRREANPLVSYVHMTVTSLIGGLCVAGLLNGTNYLVVADQFLGVKLAHYLPVALVGFYFLTRLTNARGSLKSAITWNQAVLFVVILGALGLMFLRTGNDNPEAVSGLELKIRSIMETFLVVRPRTKEILFGHPALIIGLFLLAWQTKLGDKGAKLGGWTALALTLGAIGQTSVVNTMCHIHTPLLVSVTRIGVGAVVGGIIGLLLWAAFRGRHQRAQSSN